MMNPKIQGIVEPRGKPSFTRYVGQEAIPLEFPAGKRNGSEDRGVIPDDQKSQKSGISWRAALSGEDKGKQKQHFHNIPQIQ